MKLKITKNHILKVSLAFLLSLSCYAGCSSRDWFCLLSEIGKGIDLDRVSDGDTKPFDLNRVSLGQLPSSRSYSDPIRDITNGPNGNIKHCTAALTTSALDSDQPSVTRVPRRETTEQTETTYYDGMNEGDSSSIPVRGVSDRMQAMIDALRNNYTKNCTNAGAGSAPANHSCSGARTGRLYGKCWQYVKHGLIEGGFADEYIASASALDAHTDGHLTNAGFTNMIGEYQTSGNAPAGAILIYEWSDEDSPNKDGRHGHIEVKTPQGEYISDFSETRGIDVRNSERKLVGIYIEDQR